MRSLFVLLHLSLPLHLQVTVESIAKRLRQAALMLLWKDCSPMLSAALAAICAHFEKVAGMEFTPQLVTVDDSALGKLGLCIR
jgi:hypothetical protein